MWCGPRISGGGVKYDPSMIQWLRVLEEPINVEVSLWSQLDKTLCSRLWSRVGHPPESVTVTSKRKGFSQTVQAEVCAAGDQVEECELWRAYRTSRECYHPNDIREICIFKNASDSLLRTHCDKVSSEDVKVEKGQQRHEPLDFLNGTFKESRLRWSVIEKEAFLIVEATAKLRHFLVQEKLVVDIRFRPWSISLGTLCRREETLQGFRSNIVHECIGLCEVQAHVNAEEDCSEDLIMDPAWEVKLN